MNINPNATIGADNKLRFSAEFYASLVEYMANNISDAMMKELANGEECKLKFADESADAADYLKGAYLSAQFNGFTGYLAGAEFGKAVVEQCVEDLALKVVYQGDMQALVASNLPRIMRSFKRVFLEKMEECLDNAAENISEEHQDPRHPRLDVIVKNREWLISAAEAVSLEIVESGKAEEQTAVEAEEVEA